MGWCKPVIKIVYILSLKFLQEVTIIVTGGPEYKLCLVTVGHFTNLSWVLQCTMGEEEGFQTLSIVGKL